MRAIQTDEELATFVRAALETRHLCRIYQDDLIVCFSPDGKAACGNRIEMFAARNGWQVEVHSPDNQGIVADFIRGVAHPREVEFQAS